MPHLNNTIATLREKILPILRGNLVTGSKKGPFLPIEKIVANATDQISALAGDPGLFFHAGRLLTLINEAIDQGDQGEMELSYWMTDGCSGRAYGLDNTNQKEIL